MTICYVVPGILSSELFYDPALQVKIWVDYTALSLGQVGMLRLAGGGILPGPPDGHQMHAGGPLPDYFGVCVGLLRQQLGPYGYNVEQFGYEWRMHFFPPANQLANKIRSNVTASDPCVIVGHSMGGLVARAAWVDLGQTGQQNLVKRIITLGTPHQGSYAPVWAFSVNYQAINQLVYLANVVGGNINRIHPLTGFPTWTPETLRDLLCTWPALYDLLPVLGSPDASADISRPMLYDRSNWNGIPAVSQLHLDYAKNVVGPFMRSPGSFPPNWILTTVAGTGVDTPAALAVPQDLGSPLAIAVDPDGDGAVTQDSALVNPGVQFVLPCIHADLPLITAQSGNLAQWIMDVRGPLTPVPPPLVLGAPLTPTLAGPPVPLQLGNVVHVTGCAAGYCRC